MTEIKIGSSIMGICDNGKAVLFTESSRRNDLKNTAKLNFEIHENAEHDSVAVNNVMFLGFEHENNAITLKYSMNGQPIEIYSKYEGYEGSNALRVTNTVRNVGGTSVDLNYISSSFIDNIGGAGSLPMYDDDKFRVHYCFCSWQKEGQWKSESLSDLGINVGTVHAWETNEHKISSLGSLSTKKFYPLVMVEDLECGTVWFTEIEGGNNWEIGVGCIGGYNSSSVYLRSSSANEHFGGWRHTLCPGEEYITRSSVVGCIDGGFDDAVRTLLAYKRASSLISFEDRDIPVVFNDYMDCLWCRRSEEKMTRLIDAAADAGCETFCIDAGWHKNVGNGANWSEKLGDWAIDDSGFGERGLAGTLNYIKERGMNPGVWFELESCSPSAAIYETENVILKRNSHKINAARAFINFCEPKAVEHLESRIDELYALGVRYIKNDYNRCTGFGTDSCDINAAEGLRKNVDAFYAFMDHMMAKYPDLVIESCNSGGTREDSGTLRHFYLQSTSDQEFYFNYPSIICGSLAVMAPEKAGIWSYPYPVPLADAHRDIDIGGDYFAPMADGEQTIFNMVNGMCGSLYLSGRIDFCDEYNRSLVREGVETFKSYRAMLKHAYPIFPLGQLTINKRGHLSLGLVSEKEDEIILAVWKIDAKDDATVIDLSKRLTDTSKVEMLYPRNDSRVNFQLDSGRLRVSFPKNKKYVARMFKITL